MSQSKTWRERIVEARKRRRFTGAEKHMACGTGWGHCAVGEQHQAMPLVIQLPLEAETGHYGAPSDAALRRDGLEFGRVVWRDDFDAAERLLDAIEDRVLVLKREAPEPKATHP